MSAAPRVPDRPESTLRRAYLSGEPDTKVQAHLRIGGNGPTVLLLPDAPGTGAALAPLARDLIEAGCTVAVPDLIGAGGTTYDADCAGDLPAQARLALAVLAGLGWRRTVVVGDGAGAAVGLQLAAARPDLVAGIAVLAAPYAGPRPVPEWDGTPSRHGEHLVCLWHELRDHQVFSPYWLPVAQNRRRRAMPATLLLHEIFADTVSHAPAHRRLAEGARRAWAALVAGAEVPIVDVPPPGNAAAARACLGRLPRADVPRSTPVPAVTVQGLTRSYIDADHGQLHVRTCRPADDAGPALPVLLLHANPGSAQGLEPLLAALGRERLAVAFDLPGHGRSDRLPTGARDGATLDGTYVPVLLQAMDALGLDRVDVYGTHTGAGLAVELALAAPRRVRSLILDGVPLFDDDPALVSSVLEEYFVDLTPDRHGSHLVRAWNVTWDMALWWPWFRQQPDSIRDVDAYPAGMIQRTTADLLRSLPDYEVSYRAAWTWRCSERLPLVTQPVLVGSSPTDPLRAMTPRAAALLRNARETEFPPPQSPAGVDRLARHICDFTEDPADGG
jgi:pimeloyl-ACP methyl ester carboxylesterase